MSLASKGHDQFDSFLILCDKILQLLFQEFYCFNGRLLAQLKPFDISLLQQPLAPSALLGCHSRHGCLMPMSGFGLETTCRPSPLPSAPGTTSQASSSFIFHCPPLPHLPSISMELHEDAHGGVQVLLLLQTCDPHTGTHLQSTLYFLYSTRQVICTDVAIALWRP